MVMRNFTVGLVLTFLLGAVWGAAEPIDFNEYTIQGVSQQDRTGTASIHDGGATLELSGNLWKYIEFEHGELLNIPPALAINFDFRSDEEGEIQGIMLGTDVTPANTFQAYGTQDYGTQLQPAYTLADEGTYLSYSAPIGQTHEGQSFTALTFVGDHDSGGTQISFFSNVEIVPEPGMSVLVGISMLCLMSCRRGSGRQT